jgi:hypothetical protein
MFEAICPKFPGYLDAVKARWDHPVLQADPCRVLDIKFWNTAKDLMSWSQKFIGSIRFKLGLLKRLLISSTRLKIIGRCRLKRLLYAVNSSSSALVFLL